MIPNVIDPIRIKMISACMVATAHLTMRTTIEGMGTGWGRKCFNALFINLIIIISYHAS